MGPRTRRAARMYDAASAGHARAKLLPVSFFSQFNASPRAMAVATAALCLVLVCAFLHQPARQYYQSVRENARLEAEYAVLAERNAALTERNESLSSDAGIEQTAHEEYGWVKKGEQTATVEGLSGDYVAKSEGSTVRESIPSGSVEAPATWYSPVLDFVFGVE